MSTTSTTTARDVFNDIEAVAMTVEGLSQQLAWHAGILNLAAPRYDGTLNLHGLLEIMDSMAKRMGETADRLQEMAEMRVKLLRSHHAAAGTCTS